MGSTSDMRNVGSMHQHAQHEQHVQRELHVQHEQHALACATRTACASMRNTCSIDIMRQHVQPVRHVHHYHAACAARAHESKPLCISVSATFEEQRKLQAGSAEPRALPVRLVGKQTNNLQAHVEELLRRSTAKAWCATRGKEIAPPKLHPVILRTIREW